MNKHNHKYARTLHFIWQENQYYQMDKVIIAEMYYLTVIEKILLDRSLK